MKTRTLAIAFLCACSLIAAAQAGKTMPVSLFAAGATTTTTTTTVTTTNADGTTTKKETTVTTTSDENNAAAAADAEVSPEDGGYTYVDYEGVTVPYYKGYFFINGVWVWRRPGKPPFPPPRFRPRLLTKPPVPVKPAPKPPVKKPAPVKRPPAKAPRRSAPPAPHR